VARNISSVIGVLRTTARELGRCTDYQWGHMGSCNCGYLAQQITHLNKNQIHNYAMQRYGDWNEQLNDYCPTSGLPMDELISEMLNFGFDRDDLKNLERLSDKQILSSLPPDERYLRHNVKGDVIKYLNTWAALLELECVAEIKLGDLQVHQAVEGDV
jgi:hypothetical protein